MLLCENFEVSIIGIKWMGCNLQKTFALCDLQQRDRHFGRRTHSESQETFVPRQRSQNGRSGASCGDGTAEVNIPFQSYFSILFFILIFSRCFITRCNFYFHLDRVFLYVVFFFVLVLSGKRMNMQTKFWPQTQSGKIFVRPLLKRWWDVFVFHYFNSARSPTNEYRLRPAFFELHVKFLYFLVALVGLVFKFTTCQTG